MKRAERQEYDPGSVSDALRTWYSGSIGQGLIGEIQPRLDALMHHRFGYHALQIGRYAPDLLAGCAIKNHIHMDVDPAHGEVSAHAHALPFDEDSLDLIVLMHSLDFAQDPHEVLREVDRTLIPQGYAVIIGFNPWSLFGLWHLGLRRWDRVPWNGRFYNSTRIRDWLALLGFDTLDSKFLGFRPPIAYDGVYERLAFMEKAGRRVAPILGGVYVLFAQKQVAKLTPIKTVWRPRRKLLGGLAEPSTRRARESVLSRDR